jgi:hypothetical protein
MSKVDEVKTFEEVIPLINEKYIALLSELIEKFKYHDELIGPLEHDLKLTNEKLPTNKYQVINTITENFLYCIEQIADYNSDYFIYQKEKIQKNSGKVIKNKLPKIGNKTLLKRVLNELDNKSINNLFKNIIELFTLLTYVDDDNILFNQDYITFVKNNFNENKHFSKMLMVFDNINNILNNQIEENIEENDLSDIEEEPKKDDKSKGKNKKNKKKNNGSDMGMDFMKGLENTKIAQLAKNISQKINVDEFPLLSDPTKLFSSLSNPSENGGGIQDLLKFVVGEVEGAFKNNNMNENDLVSEAQNIMGQFSNMSGFDPMSMLKEGNLDMNQFADIFSSFGKK